MQQSDEKTLLYLFPGFEVYEAALREIFEEPPNVFAKRFPLLAIAWAPFMRRLISRHFDIDSLRKAASDLWDFQHWLVSKNRALVDISPSLIDAFIRDLRARHRKRTGHPMDRRAVRDVRGAIECFLDFAGHRPRLPSRNPPGS